jgi:hypothetical protein
MKPSWSVRSQKPATDRKLVDVDEHLENNQKREFAQVREDEDRKFDATRPRRRPGTSDAKM